MADLRRLNRNYPGLFRLMSRKDWERFSEFVREYYHRRYILLDREFFEWQYRRGPLPRTGDFSVKIVAQEPRLLGFCGFVPYDIRTFGKAGLRAAGLCNLMVARECRALGVGLALVESVAGDFDVTWGTGYAMGEGGKSRTGPIFEKAGWRIMEELGRYVAVLDGTGVARLAYGPEFRGTSPFAAAAPSAVPGGAAVTEVERFSSEVERLWEGLADKYPIAVARHAEYLNWRYADHPRFRYWILVACAREKWNGYVVFRVEQATEADGGVAYTVGRIVDIVAHESAERPLLAAALQALRESGAVMADYFSTGSFHREALESLDFFRCDVPLYRDIPRRLSPVDRAMLVPVNFVLRVGETVPQRERFFDSTNWYITTGEGDIDRPNNPPPVGEPRYSPA